MAVKNLDQYFSRVPKKLERLFDKAGNFWDVLPELAPFLKQKIRPKMKGVRIGEVYIDNDVFVGKGTVIEHGAMLKGPAFIGENCQIRSGAYIREGSFIENNCIVGHAVEIKNSILMEGAHAGHFNYVGDSILGRKVNLGAGSVLANLRFDEKEIKIEREETGLKKLGAILGDDCQIGCNTVLNPGVVFEKGVWYSGKPLKGGFYNQEKLKNKS